MSTPYQLTPRGDMILRVADGAFIPQDHGNRDYQEYLAWVAAGNTIDPAPVPPKPTTISSGAFLDRFTSAEQTAIQQAAQSNPGIALGLTMGLAKGYIILNDSVVTNWMQSLVTANVITQARMSEILTP